MLLHSFFFFLFFSKKNPSSWLIYTLTKINRMVGGVGEDRENWPKKECGEE